MDLSKRANLHGVREVRGLLHADANAPAGVTGADWTTLCELRADATDDSFYTFTGEASVVDSPYTVYDMFGEFTETVRSGAFKRTIGRDPLVSFVYMHDLATVMAQTRGGNLTLTADPNLGVEARLDKTDIDVQRVAPKTLRGDANSMSFAFRVTDQRWNDDYTEREILEVDLHNGDVSIITTGHGANPAAHGSMRAADEWDVVCAWIDSLDATDPEIVDELVTRCNASETFTARLAAMTAPAPADPPPPAPVLQFPTVDLRDMRDRMALDTLAIS